MTESPTAKGPPDSALTSRVNGPGSPEMPKNPSTLLIWSISPALRLVSLVAATLPYVEFLAGVLLLLNVRVRPALVAIGGMTLIFMVALLSVLVRGLDIDCGCFDPAGGQDVSAGVALLRDIGLLGLVALTWWLRGRLTPVASGAKTLKPV